MIIFFIFLLVVIPSSICLAEPSRQIQYLMHEPLSLFDSGLLRIEQHIKWYYGKIYSGEEGMSVLTREDVNILKGGNIVGSIHYDYDKNRLECIIICGIYMPIENNQLRQLSSNIINDMKNMFGYDKSGKRIFGGLSVLEHWFSHIAYTTKDKPENLGKELENIIEIILNIDVYDKETKTGKSLRVHSKLTEPEILFSESVQAGRD
jgi:hypothetical protein